LNPVPQLLSEDAFGLQETVPLPILCVMIAYFPGMFSRKAPSLALRHEVLLFYLLRRGEQINEMTDGVSCVSDAAWWSLQAHQARLSVGRTSSRC
jgi:hypothetical protein